MSDLLDFDYSKIKKDFLNLFYLRMLELGFDKKKSWTFYKTTVFGKVGVGLSIWKNYNCMDVAPSVSIRIDELENLLDGFRDSILNEKESSSFSVGANIGNIRSGVYRKWQIYYESEIKENIDEIVEMVKIVGLPYIEKYSNPQEMFSGLINPKTGWLLSPMIAYRIQKALALTFVLDDYDLFLKESLEGEKILINHPQGKVKEFLLLRDWLNIKFKEKQA
jgi:hypothetical protein